MIKYILLFLFLIGQKYCIRFAINLKPVSSRCIGQTLSDKQLSIVEANSTQNNIQIRVFDKSSKLIYEVKDNKQLKISFTTHQSGTFQICIDNTHQKKNLDIDFKFEFGVAAKDYSVLAQHHHLFKIEEQMQQIEDYFNAIKKKHNFMIGGILKLTTKYEWFFSNLPFYAVTLILIQILSSRACTYILQRVLKQKKVI